MYKGEIGTTGTPNINIFVVQAVAHLAWKKWVCRGRAAFDITFQHHIFS